MTPARARDVVELAAVGRGAAVAIAICLPLALISQQLVDREDGSPFTALLFLTVLVGFVVGGYVAARAASSAPFTNGGLAALLAFVAIQGTALAVRLAADDDPPAFPVIVFNGLLAYGCGLAGGAIAARRRGKGDA